VLIHRHRRCYRRSGSLVAEAGACEEQWTVVLSKALSEPQTAGHVLAREIERLDPDRADTFHIPVVEKLMGDASKRLLPALRCFQR